MGKYNDWTRGEDEAILNMIGGLEVARAVLRGEYKLSVSAVNHGLLTTYDPSVGLRKLMELAVGEQNAMNIHPKITQDKFPLREGVQRVNLEVARLPIGWTPAQFVQYLTKTEGTTDFLLRVILRLSCAITPTR